MAETPTLSLSFDKTSYYIGEIAQLSVSGATPNTIYTLALKNSRTGELFVIQTFQAPLDTFVIPLRILLEFANAYWDQIVLISPTETISINKPTIILEGGTLKTEYLEVDKLRYNIGELINWKASNLIEGRVYQVALIVNGNYVYVLERDRWTATTTTKSGSFPISTSISPGTYRFALFDVTNGMALVDYKTITIVAPKAEEENWWQKIIQFLTSPFGILILGILALLYILFKK